MIIHCNSFRYLWEVLEKEEYSFVFKHLVVLDIGACIGSFSLWIAPYAKQIYAIEAEQKHIDNFNKTINSNKITNIKTYVEKLTDIKDFMQRNDINRVDVMKIDIEGDEYAIFGKEDFPTKKVSTIIGEYHKGSLETILTAKGYFYIDLPNKHFIARR